MLALQIGASTTQALALTAREVAVEGDENEFIRQPGKYFRSLASASAVLRDYHAWRNAFLLSPEFKAAQNRARQGLHRRP